MTCFSSSLDLASASSRLSSASRSCIQIQAQILQITNNKALEPLLDLHLVRRKGAPFHEYSHSLLGAYQAAIWEYVSFNIVASGRTFQISQNSKASFGFWKIWGKKQGKENNEKIWKKKMKENKNKFKYNNFSHVFSNLFFIFFLLYKRWRIRKCISSKLLSLYLIILHIFYGKPKQEILGSLYFFFLYKKSMKVLTSILILAISIWIRILSNLHSFLQSVSEIGIETINKIFLFFYFW